MSDLAHSVNARPSIFRQNRNSECLRRLVGWPLRMLLPSPPFSPIAIAFARGLALASQPGTVRCGAPTGPQVGKVGSLFQIGR